VRAVVCKGGFVYRVSMKNACRLFLAMVISSGCGSDSPPDLISNALVCDVCDANAQCVVEDGVAGCECTEGYTGDGMNCASQNDESLAGCAVMQAEHPGYTNIARDVVLCGSKYDPTNIETACNDGWHVCLESEWLDRYPTARPYNMDPDPTVATLGQFTSWGDPQLFRCGGNVWVNNAPTEIDAYDESVCYYPGDDGDNGDGADYLPNNDGKFLFDDNGATVLQGRNANGDADCCSWDVTWGALEAEDGFAVYCCRD